MRFSHYVFAAVCLLAVAAGSSAEPKNGVEYFTLDTPQATEQTEKVEVLEFFGYFCPHCYSLDPLLENWVKKQGSNIVFKRVHTSRSGTVLPQQRMYYTLEAMGKLDELHKKIFNKIHVGHRMLNDEGTILDFIAEQGIDKQKFLDVYNSFSIQAKVQRAAQLEASYKLTGVPQLAIDGRFITSPAIAGRGLPPDPTEATYHNAALRVMDALVEKAGKEHSKDKKQNASSTASKTKQRTL